MTVYYPIGKVYLGRVPYDDTYKDTILNFNSQSAQAEYFFSNVITAHIDDNAYTYIRANTSIKVNKNIEELYTYNYVMYKNENYTNKWFYAFITDMKFINENCTELVIATDVIQTWFFEIVFHECMIERAHVPVASDIAGNYLLPEPSLPLIYETKEFNVYSAFPRYVVFLINKLPSLYTATDISGVPLTCASCSGNIYQKQYSGCLPLIFDVEDSMDTGLRVLDIAGILREFLHDMDMAGIAESIVCAYTIPQDTISSLELLHPTNDTSSGGYYAYSISPNFFEKFTTVKVPTKNCNVMNIARNISKPTSFRNNFVPKNKKLLTYPYTFLTVGDFSGNDQDYRWEFWNGNNAQFRDSRLINEEGVGYLTPLYYNGNETDSIDYKDRGMQPFTYSYSNEISYMNDAFVNWLSQNRIATAVSLASGIAALPMLNGNGISKSISRSHTESNRAYGGMNNDNINGLQSFTRFDMRSQDRVVEYERPNDSNYFDLIGALGDIDEQFRVPNMTKGNVNGNSKVQNGYSGYYTATRCIISECAHVIDNYFEMYGYYIMNLNNPSNFINNRSKWNYIKTLDADFQGNMPQNDISAINSIFNKGIRFWHTAATDVGNYSLNNHA